jgi:small basic protein
MPILWLADYIPVRFLASLSCIFFFLQPVLSRLFQPLLYLIMCYFKLILKHVITYLCLVKAQASVKSGPGSLLAVAGRHVFHNTSAASGGTLAALSLSIPMQSSSRSHHRPPDFSAGPWHFEVQKQLDKLKLV